MRRGGVAVGGRVVGEVDAERPRVKGLPAREEDGASARVARDLVQLREGLWPRRAA